MFIRRDGRLLDDFDNYLERVGRAPATRELYIRAGRELLEETGKSFAALSTELRAPTVRVVGATAARRQRAVRTSSADSAPVASLTGCSLTSLRAIVNRRAQRR
jgi:hypothetical protein